MIWPVFVVVHYDTVALYPHFWFKVCNLSGDSYRNYFWLWQTLLYCFWFLIMLYFQRPQLVKGNLQLFSVDQQRSQALEAHAASFAQYKVCNFLYCISKSLYILFPLPFADICWYMCTYGQIVSLNFIVLNRFQGMRTLPFLFPLPLRRSMLDRLHPSCMLLSSVPSQVGIHILLWVSYMLSFPINTWTSVVFKYAFFFIQDLPVCEDR